MFGERLLVTGMAKKLGTVRWNVPSHNCVWSMGTQGPGSSRTVGFDDVSLPGYIFGIHLLAVVSQAPSRVHGSGQNSCPWLSLQNFHLSPSTVSMIPNILIKCDKDTELFGLYQGEQLDIWKHLDSLPEKKQPTNHQTLYLIIWCYVT